MSQQLARRTRTVSAVVAAVTVTVLAGAWPALDTAGAAERVVRASTAASERAAQPPTDRPADTTTTTPTGGTARDARQDRTVRTRPTAPGAGDASGSGTAHAMGSVPRARQHRPAAAPLVPARPVLGPVSRPVSRPVLGPVLGPVLTAGPGTAPLPARASLPRQRLAPVRRHVGLADALPLPPADEAPQRLVGPPVPQPRPRALPVDLARVLPDLASGTVGAVAERPQLPIGVAVVVMLFLVVQSRIDRRDPKLALAPLEDDAPLEFQPGLGHARLGIVTAA